GFEQFAAFDQDAIDNKDFLAKGKLAMPVLAIGGGEAFGLTKAGGQRHAPRHPRARRVPPPRPLIMEKKTPAPHSLVREFLAARSGSDFDLEAKRPAQRGQAGTAPGLPLSTTNCLSVDTVALGSRRSEMTRRLASMRSRATSTAT